MKERPILFSAPMLRALLAGQKTQTRRAWRVQPPPGTQVGWVPGQSTTPYGKSGDRLWVRETWRVGSRPCPHEGGVDGLEYRADEVLLEEGDLLPLYRPELPDDVCLGDFHSGWRPSIHMFRWASRITLEITDVRVERLQDISRGDAMAEGCPFPNMAAGDDPREWFHDLWAQINGAESWDANPWAWVVEFGVVKP